MSPKMPPAHQTEIRFRMTGNLLTNLTVVLKKSAPKDTILRHFNHKDITMEMKTKTCTRCGQEKPLSEFGKNRGLKDGFSYWCRQCWRKYHAEYREKNRARITAHNKQYWVGYYQEHKERIRAARTRYLKEQQEKKG